MRIYLCEFKPIILGAAVADTQLFIGKKYENDSEFGWRAR